MLSFCRNKITIVSVAKDMEWENEGVYVQHEGIVGKGERWPGTTGGGRCRIDQPYKILIH